MSVSVLRMNKNERGFDLNFEIPIATQSFYDKYWQKAIDELDLKYIQQDSEIKKEHTAEVIKELGVVRQWAINNLSDNNLEYMLSRIELLIKMIPTGFPEGDEVLWLG